MSRPRVVGSSTLSLRTVRLLLAGVAALGVTAATPWGVAASTVDHDASRIQVLHANWTTFSFPLVPGNTYQFINLDAVQGWSQTGSSRVAESRVFLSVNVCVAETSVSCGSGPGSWGFIGGGSADGVVIAGELTSGSIDATVEGYRCDSSGCSWQSVDVDGTFTAAGPTVNTADTNKFEPEPGVRIIATTQSRVTPATTAITISGIANLGNPEPGEQLIAEYLRVSSVIE